MSNKTVDGTGASELMLLGFTDPTDGLQITTIGDRIRSFGGDDTIFASGGPDRVWAGDGDDVVLGEAGNDRLAGDKGDDLLFGIEGNDTLIGGRGNDRLDGGTEDDKLYGNKGNNTLIGGEGNDLLDSGDQSSTLEGGEGNDSFLLRGKKGGDHEATGGTGADNFDFQLLSVKAQSDMTITDFELGVDTFSVEGVPDWVYAFAVLDKAMVTEDGGDAVVTLDTGDTVRFQGVSEAAFEAFYNIPDATLPPAGFAPADEGLPPLPPAEEWWLLH